ncbi:MAG: hypothetical protein MR989_06025 [Prevotella sp.]|nr:hypothetical protein [Prevotella sp.]
MLRLIMLLISTPQHNKSQHLTISTPHHLNTSTPQHLTISTPHHHNTSPSQHLNITTHHNNPTSWTNS